MGLSDLRHWRCFYHYRLDLGHDFLHHRLGIDHLDRYLGEFCWRYNRRGIQPMLFNIMLGNLAAAKPMPYKELTKF